MNFNRINLFHFICTQLKYYRILIPIIYIFTLDCIIFVVMIRLDRAGIYLGRSDNFRRARDNKDNSILDIIFKIICEFETSIEMYEKY